MDRRIEHGLNSQRTVSAACAISFAIGLFFIFVWAPHPWGWGGFDHYHDLALDLARGRPFPTMEVPWAYAYFLAAFYRTFGVHPWIPLVVQAAMNALVPLLVFTLARWWFNRETAVLAAVLTGIFSFNTVYASTLSSDAVCTVIFMAAVVAFTRALVSCLGSSLLHRGRRGARMARREEGEYREYATDEQRSQPGCIAGRMPTNFRDTTLGARGGLAWFALAGLLTGIAPQFRPNLILVPLLLAAYALWAEPTRRRLAQVAVLLACTVLALTPWVVRNYRLTGMVLPTSVHSGVQLWYGTLQVGPYLHSRAYNPRYVFEAPVFDYTSLDNVPIIVEGLLTCTQEALTDVALVYWSDYDATERRLVPARTDDKRYTFEIPAPRRDGVVIYYYFVTGWSGEAGRTVRTTPPAGAHAPLVYFVNANHLDDVDLHGDLLDVFDVGRLVRAAAWNEPVAFADKLRAAGVTDAREAVTVLMRRLVAADAKNILISVELDATTARMTFSDGSTIVIPREWRGRITDWAFTGNVASTLMTSRTPLGAIEAAPARRPSSLEVCTQVGDIAVNQVFYRKEPHLMGRYSALAIDNIRRDPVGFALASAYRAVRLFVISGTSDRSTAQQFAQSRWIYMAGTGVSILYVTLFGIGLVVAWRRGYHVSLPLLLIAYLPATLAPVLTNMRYTLTVQPLMFMFIAATIATVLASQRRF